MTTPEPAQPSAATGDGWSLLGFSGGTPLMTSQKAKPTSATKPIAHEG